jgi:hypothetical protein
MADLKFYAQQKDIMRQQNRAMRQIMAHTPSPDEADAQWLDLKCGRFLATRAYLRGALDVQSGGRITFKNPYPPGPELAQYNYGYANELHGFHDALDLPFERIGK